METIEQPLSREDKKIKSWRGVPSIKKEEKILFNIYITVGSKPWPPAAASGEWMRSISLQAGWAESCETQTKQWGSWSSGWAPGWGGLQLHGQGLSLARPFEAPLWISMVHFYLLSCLIWSLSYPYDRDWPVPSVTLYYLCNRVQIS